MPDDCQCLPSAGVPGKWDKDCSKHGIDSDWIIESEAGRKIQCGFLLPWQRRMLTEAQRKYNERHTDYE